MEANLSNYRKFQEKKSRVGLAICLPVLSHRTDFLVGIIMGGDPNHSLPPKIPLMLVGYTAPKGAKYRAP